MKKIVALFFFFLSSQVQGTLPKDVSIEAFVFNKGLPAITSVRLEVCLKDLCPKPETTIACKKLSADRWTCSHDQIPHKFRFQILAGKKSVLTELLTLDGRVGKYAIHLQKDGISAMDVSHNLVFNVKMQGSLEEVFEPGMVEQIMAAEANKSADKFIPHKGKTKIGMKVCENDSCEKGKVDEVVCSLQSKGVNALIIDCPRVEFARYGQLALYGRDKNRTSAYFLLNQKNGVSISAEPVLEMLP